MPQVWQAGSSGLKAGASQDAVQLRRGVRFEQELRHVGKGCRTQGGGCREEAYARFIGGGGGDGEVKSARD